MPVRKQPNPKPKPEPKKESSSSDDFDDSLITGVKKIRKTKNESDEKKEEKIPKVKDISESRQKESNHKIIPDSADVLKELTESIEWLKKSSYQKQIFDNFNVLLFVAL